MHTLRLMMKAVAVCLLVVLALHAVVAIPGSSAACSLVRINPVVFIDLIYSTSYYLLTMIIRRCCLADLLNVASSFCIIISSSTILSMYSSGS